jgi:hypothetical protein
MVLVIILLAFRAILGWENQQKSSETVAKITWDEVFLERWNILNSQETVLQIFCCFLEQSQDYKNG